jgi:PAS domain S-box-containing protein
MTSSRQHERPGPDRREDEEFTSSLRESEDRFRAVVESVSDYAIILLTPQGRVVTWNRGAASMTGWRADEIVGQPLTRFYPPEVVARGWPQRELDLARQHGRFEDENWRLRKDGSRYWAGVVITALRDPGDGVQGFLKITKDLTERRDQEDALRLSEERMRLLVDGVRDVALYLLDEDGRITSWNSGAERITGFAAHEVLGKDFGMFFTREDRERGAPRQHLVAAQQLGRLEDEGWRVRRPGGRFWANTTLTALRSREGRLLGFAKVTRDESERRHIEVLEESRRRIDEFLAMLGHELRNPLAPIANAVQLLQAVHTTDERVMYARDVIERQAGHLARLVEDLLDVSRISSGKITLRREPLDARELVERALEASRPMAEARQQSLAAKLPAMRLPVVGDPVRLVQVLVNLVNNAVKFTPNGGHVTVSAASEGADCVLRVRDDGVGIAPDVLPRIFDVFVQGESSLGRSAGGLGLGLTLVRRLVELHGGAVEARSEGPGRGSEFSVRLPLSADAPSAAPASPSRASESATPLRILLVDDNRDSADSLACLLRLGGHEVRVAYDAVEALAAARSFDLEVGVLDIGLPGMSGLELAVELRASAPRRRTQLIALSGYGQDADRERSREAGFDAHLVKPVSPDDLLHLLARAERRPLSPS